MYILQESDSEGNFYTKDNANTIKELRTKYPAMFAYYRTERRNYGLALMAGYSEVARVWKNA